MHCKACYYYWDAAILFLKKYFTFQYSETVGLDDFPIGDFDNCGFLKLLFHHSGSVCILWWHVLRNTPKGLLYVLFTPCR
jgi:hypothetical protein